MISLGRLVREAGDAFAATAPFDPTRTVTGVHVSELTDPGRYLNGGELLLTTGIPLTGRDGDTAYVTRLAEHGVAAIGLGLGEGWDEPPPGLLKCCAAAGVPLFVVPDGRPFLAVSRVFWQMLSQEDRAAVVRATNSHTELARAAGGNKPLLDVVRIVAEGIGGWAAWVPFDSQAAGGFLYPPSLSGLLPSVAKDVDRSLRRSGAAAASFIAHGSVAVAHAVEARSRIWGALAVGVGRPLTRTDRALAMTAVALLELVLGCAPQDSPGAARWVAALAIDGDTTAARSLARAAQIDLPTAVRVLATSTDSEASLDQLAVNRGAVRLVLVASTVDPDVEEGAFSSIVPLEEVPMAAARAVALRHRTPPGGLATEDTERADRWVAILESTRAGLVETVHAYLRNGQRIDRAARVLNVHRNTVRQRLATAERIIGISLSDPDATAELWLSLRARPAFMKR